MTSKELPEGRRVDVLGGLIAVYEADGRVSLWWFDPIDRLYRLVG